MVWRMFALVLLTALADGNAPVPALPALDAPGRAMLHPARAQALHPDELVARLHLAADAVVVDVGAGPGWLSLPLARAVPRGRVIATDVRADYLAVAHARADEAGVHNLETRVVTPSAPGLAPSSVDLALLCQVDAYLPDRAQYFSLLKQSLRNSGRIAIVSQLRHRGAVLQAAERAELRVSDEWAPSPGYFVVVLEGA